MIAPIDEEKSLNPFLVTRKQLYELFASASLVKSMVKAGWIKIIRDGKPGREALFDYESARAAWGRLKAGEDPEDSTTPA